MVQVSTKQELIKSTKLAIKKLAPKLMKDAKTLRKELTHIVRQIPRVKNEPSKLKRLERRFTKTLVKYHKRMSQKAESEEPSLGKKILVSVVALIVASVAKEVILALLIREYGLSNYETLVITQKSFIDPMLVEFFKMYLESKYQAGLVFTNIVTAVTLPPAAAKFLGLSRYENEVEREFYYSTRWVGLLLVLLRHGLQYVNYYIQKRLIEKSKKEDKFRLKVAAFIISVILDALFSFGYALFLLRHLP